MQKCVSSSFAEFKSYCGGDETFCDKNSRAKLTIFVSLLAIAKVLRFDVTPPVSLTTFLFTYNFISTCVRLGVLADAIFDPIFVSVLKLNSFQSTHLSVTKTWSHKNAWSRAKKATQLEI